MEVKDRLKYPVDFLESMLGNFKKPKYQKAQTATHQLIVIIKAKDKSKLAAWIENISFDPESLGTAFFMVYQFAEDYLERMKSKNG